MGACHVIARSCLNGRLSHDKVTYCLYRTYIHTQQSTSDQSQDEDGAPSTVRDRLSILAEELLEKWKSLKEVFRIPKRTPLVFLSN